MIPLRLLAAGLALAASALPASADFTAAVIPPFRGSPCAAYAGFEVFTSPYAGANTPDLPSSDTTATITQLIPGAILTSTGNIYHPSQIPAFRLEHSATSDVLEVVLQASTLGNPRNHGSFVLSFVDAGGQPVVLAPTGFQVLVSLPAQREELWFRWDLSARTETILSYRIDWVSSASNSSLDSVLLDALTDCPPGVAQCFGDGTGVACPCGNAGAAGHGCANSVDPSGARLTASGTASIAADSLVLVASGMPNSSCLYFQGTSASQLAFGDGLRCAGGSVVRLGTRSNVAGASQYPGSGQEPISVRGAVAAGDARIYQAWYRNAAAFCTTSTFNLSNAYSLTWAP